MRTTIRRVVWALAAVMAGLLLALRPTSAGQSAEAFFPNDGVLQIRVSPSGDWIAAEARKGDESMVIVQRVGLPKLVSLVSAEWIGRVVWDGPDSLIVESSTPSDIRTFHSFRLDLAGDEIVPSHRRISAGGELLDALPLMPGTVLWGFSGSARTGWTSAHLLTIEELVDYQKLHRWAGPTVDIGEKVAVVRGTSSHWIAQRDGTPRAALRHTEDFVALMLPAPMGVDLRTVHRFGRNEGEREVIPVGLTPDERRLLVLAYGGKNTLGLHEWDDRSNAVGREVFVHPDYDVTELLNDPLTGDLVAVAYEENGEVRYHYFDEYRDRYLGRLPAEWRRESIAVENGSADRQVLVLLDASATNPGDFYVRDRSGKVVLVGRKGENVARDGLSPVESFRVKSTDGMEVEAFLTLPMSSTGTAPLVVMPHGGPVGVRDSRTYDALNQYLASWGFAVLQVNYRGSSGRGLEFEVSARKQWARGIEDDIAAAVEHAMKQSAIDQDRLCIAGGSYGGFSALASVIRDRDRYRCAISINGVSDVLLQFDSSDSADDESASEWRTKYIGDPETERDELIGISPVYRVDQISVPTLVIQGAKDRRVDPDHAHRLALMFELYGKPYEMLEIEDAEHVPDRDQWIVIARTMRRFLTEHLTPDVPFERDPATRWD